MGTGHLTLHRQFIRAAREFGSKTAIKDYTTDKNIPYARALIASLILAGKFNKYKKGFIGIMLPTGAGCMLAVLGALMSGRVPVMINYSGRADKNAMYAQRKCGFSTIITARGLLEKIDCPEVEGMVYIDDMMNSISTGEKIKAALKSKLPVGVLETFIHKGSPKDNAVILFTSGSESDPKAVQLTHQNISSNIECILDRFNLTSEDSLLSQLPLFHVFGWTTNFWLPLTMGMSCYAYANPIDFKKICEILRENKPTFMTGTPSFYWGYVRKSEPGDFKSVRIAVAGADKTPDALRKAFKDKHDMDLLEGYGVTETSPLISVNSHEMNRPGSIGKVGKDIQVRIEHHETGELCATGEQGRILVKGPNVMEGYFDDFEETALRIRHGWYDTGDMGFLDEDGYLWHTGRLKRFTKIGGEMVSLVKVENALESHLPEGTECCVVEVPDAMKGAIIVAAITTPIEEKATLKKMRGQLTNLELPKHFIVIDEFPKMGTGKIDFRTTTDMVRTMIKNGEK